jgi:hypothetical protein
MSSDNCQALLQARTNAAMKAYGTALFRLHQFLKSCELAGDPPSLEDMQTAPELYDGAVGDENYTEQLIVTYFAMMQASRDLDRGCVVEDEPIDKLIDAFDECVTS